MCVQLESSFKKEIFKYSIIFGPRHVIVYIHPMLNLNIKCECTFVERAIILIFEILSSIGKFTLHILACV